MFCIMQCLTMPPPPPLVVIKEMDAPNFSAPCNLTDDAAVRTMVPEHQDILNALMRNAPIHGAIQDKLGKVVASAVSFPGGLFRYELAQRTAQAFGASEAESESLACATEYFHIASLLLDDLPQMDNSMERRGRICLHLLYGDDTVILGALALITRAYALLGAAISSAPAEWHLPAHALIDQCLGTRGILNGQARDLNFREGKGGRKEAASIALQKTVPLISLAFRVPALLFGADTHTLILLRRLSLYWGLFYQGVDDFKDLLEHSAVSGKTSGQDERLGRPNIALLAGWEKAERYLHRLGQLAQRCVVDLTESHSQLEFLVGFQQRLQIMGLETIRF